MKAWFRYDMGYVNVDDENIYLNNSGNWADAKKALEKSKKANLKNNWSVYKRRLLIYLLYAVGILMFVVSLDSTNGNALGFIMMIVLVVKVYRVFNPESGRKVRIPVHKIQWIEETMRGFDIHFRNLDGELDNEVIEGVDTYGMDILREIQLSRVSLDTKLTANTRNSEDGN